MLKNIDKKSYTIYPMDGIGAARNRLDKSIRSIIKKSIL